MLPNCEKKVILGNNVMLISMSIIIPIFLYFTSWIFQSLITCLKIQYKLFYISNTIKGSTYKDMFIFETFSCLSIQENKIFYKTF